jgi:hypothetical protein
VAVLVVLVEVHPIMVAQAVRVVVVVVLIIHPISQVEQETLAAFLL